MSPTFNLTSLFVIFSERPIGVTRGCRDLHPQGEKSIFGLNLVGKLLCAPFEGEKLFLLGEGVCVIVNLGGSSLYFELDEGSSPFGAK